jgi:hypothetical protein
MPDYSKGQIYKLYSHDTNLIYVGSTIQELSSRKADHVRHYRTWKRTGEKYVSSYELFKRSKFVEILSLEEYPCNSVEQLKKKEGEWIKKLKNDPEYKVLNLRIAGRTDKEYYEDNKGEISERSKIYRENNKEEIKERSKIYREKNKEEIKEQKSVKITCECGSTFRKCDKTRHMKTLKHHQYLFLEMMQGSEI